MVERASPVIAAQVAAGGDVVEVVVLGLIVVGVADVEVSPVLRADVVVDAAEFVGVAIGGGSIGAEVVEAIVARAVGDVRRGKEVEVLERDGAELVRGNPVAGVSGSGDGGPVLYRR